MPSSIAIGDYLEIGTYIGKVGNSGTSFTPHIHLGIVQCNIDKRNCNIHLIEFDFSIWLLGSK